jgi:GT2 family glycosyltransferase
MNSPHIAVVILNYNGANFLKQFLPSVIEHSEQARIYVADNLSTDHSIQVLQTEFKEVTIIQNTANTGYAGGYNAALKNIIADYYVLLNSDVEVTANWLLPIIQLFESDKTIAACQPKLLDFNKRTTFEYAGGSGGYIDKYGYPFCRGRMFDTAEEDTNQYNTQQEIFWATGACLFVRATAFNEVNGFDERYFAHMEEIDLCWRLKNKGYKIFVEPASVVYHVGGGTLQKTNPRKTFLNFRNNLSTITKNNHSAFWVLIILYRMVLDGVAAFKFLVGGQASLFVQVVKAHFAYYAWLPYLLKQRKGLKQTTKPNRVGVYQKNLVFAYYLFGKKKCSELNQRFFIK